MVRLYEANNYIDFKKITLKPEIKSKYGMHIYFFYNNNNALWTTLHTIVVPFFSSLMMMQGSRLWKLEEIVKTLLSLFVLGYVIVFFSTLFKGGCKSSKTDIELTKER